MNYKLKTAIIKNRKSFIIGAILWILLTIVFVSPLSYSIFQIKQSNLDISKSIMNIGENFTHPMITLGNIFSQGAIGDFSSLLVGFTIVYLILFFIGLARTAPKHEYTDIEHGSSDWSQHGEQYRILSRNKGIILAENNYLPEDKRGNVNVLVVGRIRIW